MILSANGIEDLFDTVEKLVDAAPPLREWRFIGLKPPRGFRFEYRKRGRTLAPKDWKFLILRDDRNNLGLRIFVPGKRLDVNDADLQIIIETGVGERAFSAVKHLEYTQQPSALENGRWLNLDVLPELLQCVH